MAEDWDNLLILDACRFDMFETQNSIAGDLQHRRSLGSESWEFLSENFADRTFHDTVYVTANPHAPKIPSGTFHAVVNLLEEGWDAELGTVHPETVVEAVQQAQNQYPEKRLIAHFMQPHYPFIGEHGRDLNHKGISIHLSSEQSDTKRKVWTNLGYGRLNRAQVVNAYRENLDIVLNYVEDLLDSLSGRSVVTSDHGNLIGETTSPIPARGYGHPRGLNSDELRIVPWLVVEGSDRRTTVADTPTEQDETDSRVVRDRLHDLGYR
ncbi:hypothetical protein [Halococcus thailandensis]|uniref:hypothetical protein n=1 Tax=Halococcus thailandensis TaxID=335952 RepID=UPI0019D40600|nr:hypothetical protein [Halococcus thailandensis]